MPNVAKGKGNPKGGKAKARKKNPQKKMKNYFKPEKINGKPKKDFRYEKSEDEMVYVPPGYGSKFCEEFGELAMATATYCGSCQLKPCICQEHKNEFIKLTVALEVDGLHASEVREKVGRMMFGHYESYFGKRNAKKKGLPKCVREELYRLCSDSESGTSEGADSEDDEVQL